jgi:hypothetical protein
MPALSAKAHKGLAYYGEEKETIFSDGARNCDLGHSAL